MQKKRLYDTKVRHGRGGGVKRMKTANPIIALGILAFFYQKFVTIEESKENVCKKFLEARRDNSKQLRGN